MDIWSKRMLLFIVMVYMFGMMKLNYEVYRQTTWQATNGIKSTERIEATDKNTNEELDSEDSQKEVKIEEPKVVSLGEFRLTAYCSCSKCCGKWALNRPKDENGKEIVYGSTGERLLEGVSIAVDPNVIPYGSTVIINGNSYIAHDSGSAIKGNRIDVYHNDHQAAKEFGVQYAEAFIES